MSLFDWFFPEQAQASHLRRLADQQRRGDRARRSSSKRSDRRLDELEGDLGFVALLLGALLQQLDEKGVLTRADVRSTIEELDGIDGAKDGSLDINVLRGFGH